MLQQVLTTNVNIMVTTKHLTRTSAPWHGIHVEPALKHSHSHRLSALAAARPRCPFPYLNLPRQQAEADALRHIDVKGMVPPSGSPPQRNPHSAELRVAAAAAAVVASTAILLPWLLLLLLLLLACSSSPQT